jgi:hypothetical protein
MLGIIIGIASVIAMTAIGQGAQNSISASIESIGANLVLVMPGAKEASEVQVRRPRRSTISDGRCRRDCNLQKFQTWQEWSEKYLLPKTSSGHRHQHQHKHHGHRTFLPDSSEMLRLMKEILFRTKM